MFLEIYVLSKYKNIFHSSLGFFFFFFLSVRIFFKIFWFSKNSVLAEYKKFFKVTASNIFDISVSGEYKNTFQKYLFFKGNHKIFY